MISLGLTHRELEQLKALLITHHRIDVSIQLLNLEHKYIGDVSSRLLGGQVTIDADAEASSRQCSVELLDPLNQLKLDSESPEDGSLYFSRMIKVIYSVISPDRSLRFDIPIFCGPLTKADRNGPVIALEASGKEKLSMGAVWKAKTYKEGQRKVWVINNILRQLGGETKIDLPGGRAARLKTPNKVNLNRETTAWTVSKRIAGGMHHLCFYDGRGVAQIRKPPSKRVYIFSEKGALLTYPQIGFNSEEAINAIVVVGGKPKGSKKTIKYRLVAPRSHPLSPWNLGRNGVPRFLVETIQDDTIKTMREARLRARARLREVLVQSVEVAFDSLPIPFLEENDLCGVNSSKFSGSFRLKKMTIPLTADGKSSIGYLAKVTPNRRQIRIRNTRKKRRARR